MADCVSLPNAAELVAQMRLCADDKSVHCKECKFVDTVNNMCMNIMVNCAADAIEQLLRKTEQLETDNVYLSQAISGMAFAEKARTEVIEKLKAENAKLKELYDKIDFERVKMKAERDAAVADIPRACGYCKHFSENNCMSIKCMNISGVNTGWEWRGVKEEEDATD